MADTVRLPPRDPDAVQRRPEHHRRADAATPHAHQRRLAMSNLKAVPREIATGVLADFFREAHVANRPAVDSETLRQAAAPVTFHRRPELNGGSK